MKAADRDPGKIFTGAGGAVCRVAPEAVFQSRGLTKVYQMGEVEVHTPRPAAARDALRPL